MRFTIFRLTSFGTSEFFDIVMFLFMGDKMKHILQDNALESWAMAIKYSNFILNGKAILQYRKQFVSSLHNAVELFIKQLMLDNNDHRVYITKDNAIRNRRKRLIKVVVSIFWLVIVFIRLGQYLRDMTQLELVDMLLLMFSIVFTFPTIHDWVRSIPEKIIRPYEAIVYERKKNVQTMYNELNEKFSSRFNKFRKDMGDTPNSKKNIIRVVVKIVAFVVLFVVITILMAKSIKQEDWAINKIVNWHDNLESDRKLLVNKIYACVVMVGLMVIVILRGVKIYSFKTSRFEKIKFVIELIILEFVMGCGLAMILSQ